jgi:hypothetical protein
VGRSSPSQTKESSHANKPRTHVLAPTIPLSLVNHDSHRPPVTRTPHRCATQRGKALEYGRYSWRTFTFPPSVVPLPVVTSTSQWNALRRELPKLFRADRLDLVCDLDARTDSSYVFNQWTGDTNGCTRRVINVNRVQRKAFRLAESRRGTDYVLIEPDYWNPSNQRVRELIRDLGDHFAKLLRANPCIKQIADYQYPLVPSEMEVVMYPRRTAVEVPYQETVAHFACVVIAIDHVAPPALHTLSTFVGCPTTDFGAAVFPSSFDYVRLPLPANDGYTSSALLMHGAWPQRGPKSVLPRGAPSAPSYHLFYSFALNKAATARTTKGARLRETPRVVRCRST